MVGLRERHQNGGVGVVEEPGIAEVVGQLAADFDARRAACGESRPVWSEYSQIGLVEKVPRWVALL